MKSILYVGDGAGIRDYIEKYNVPFNYKEIITESYIIKSSVFRHLNYFKTALRALLFCKKFDNIVFWQQYIALYSIFLMKLFPFHNKEKKIYIYYILYKKSNHTFYNSIKESFFLYLINDKRVAKAVFFSSNDYLFSKIIDSKRVVIDFKTKNVGYHNTEVESSIQDKDNSYFFSGGTSNRNYDLLISAFDGLDKKLVICSKPDNIKTKKRSNNIEIFFDRYGEDFNKLLMNSVALVLAFEDKVTVSGQLVILKALEYGKIIFIEDCAMINEGLWNIRDKSFVRVFDSKKTLIELIEKFDYENQNMYSDDAKKYYELITKNDNLFDTVLNEILLKNN